MFSQIQSPEENEQIVVVFKGGNFDKATFKNGKYVACYMNEQPIHFSEDMIDAVYRHTRSASP